MFTFAKAQGILKQPWVDFIFLINHNKPRRDVPHPLLVPVLVLYPRRIRFRFQLEIQRQLLQNY